MGTTVTRDDHRWVGNQREVTADVTFDASYTNGGEPLSASDFGLSTIENLTIESALTDGGLPVEWDDDNEVLVVYDGSHSEQAAGAAAVDGEVVRVRVKGRS
ncbi:hypothetical protein G9C85_02680 [Halorubellus sp. JP-L1]|uniref:hypothetical protein n=1 Tax=Halorubellus sp. JP-L1 TaxID=2715753 RepID=UPI00140A6287|nr:hypothetical protein [Halorubellus sp. JP-L1]NHN40544.1 hypothetical protein [Halorubellus sp. JP-L1]